VVKGNPMSDAIGQIIALAGGAALLACIVAKCAGC
jgi:phosphoribosylcarboxyaminoimidazole (NCAIR) mutase